MKRCHPVSLVLKCTLYPQVGLNANYSVGAQEIPQLQLSLLKKVQR